MKGKIRSTILRWLMPDLWAHARHGYPVNFCVVHRQSRRELVIAFSDGFSLGVELPLTEEEADQREEQRRREAKKAYPLGQAAS